MCLFCNFPGNRKLWAKVNNIQDYNLLRRVTETVAECG